MIQGKRIVVVMPAYNAETTLHRTVADIDRTIVDDIIVVDDASHDRTAAQARHLQLRLESHHTNQGYGANQKTCYRLALEQNADVVVMVHPDYQYTPKLVVPMAAMIAYGEYDMVLGSRILGKGALKGGMPVYKYVANRGLTWMENVVIGQKLSEYHTGFRAYSRELLQTLPWKQNSDDFVFDNQMIVQAHYARYRIGELSCPTRYHAEASSINFRRSVIYGLRVVQTAWQYRMSRWGLRHYPYLRNRSGSISWRNGRDHHHRHGILQ